jgi:ferredoxin
VKAKMILDKEQIPALLTALSSNARVYAPARIDGVTRFAHVGQPAGQAGKPPKPYFGFVNTTMPPKDILFPQTQKMYRYGYDQTGVAWIDPIHDNDTVILFGVRPCDARSIACLDDVFLGSGYVDEFYAPHRKNLLVVAMTCNNVAETCFCDSMGILPTAAPEADIVLTGICSNCAIVADKDEDEPDCGCGNVTSFTVTAQTAKGEAALDGWTEFLQATDSGALPEAGNEPDSGAGSSTNTTCTLKVDATNIASKLAAMYEHPLWDDITKKCLTCGACTFVCPTCYCFDISQTNAANSGERFRCWDSCMFSNYTMMAGNHNPRASKLERVRNRFMHKLCFFEERYGKSLCVGCGRCVEKCPVALDITVLIDKFGALAAAAALVPTDGNTGLLDAGGLLATGKETSNGN